MPVSNPIQTNWGSPGAIGATNPSTVSATTITIGQTAKETRSSIKPTSPSVGDIWLELNGSNYPLYGWWWRWSGVYWVSPDFVHEISAWNIAAQQDYQIYCNPTLNYFFRSLNFNTYSTTAQTGSSYWQIYLGRKTSASAVASITFGYTMGFAASTWVRTQLNTFSHVNVSSTATNLFFVQVSPVGSPGSLYAAIQAVYNYARP